MGFSLCTLVPRGRKARRKALRAPQASPPLDVVAFAHVVVAERTWLCVFDFNHQHRPVEIGVKLWRESREPGQQRLISELFKFRPHVCGIEALGPFGSPSPALHHTMSGNALARTRPLAELLLIFLIEAARIGARLLDAGVGGIVQIIVVGEPGHGGVPRAAVAAGCRENGNVDACGPELADGAGEPRWYAADHHDLR